MGLLKTIIVGAAVVAGYKYATKKRIEDGKSFLDDIQDNIPGWKEKAMEFANKAKQDYAPNTTDLHGM
jgi:hypothetical protein